MAKRKPTLRGYPVPCPVCGHHGTLMLFVGDVERVRCVFCRTVIRPRYFRRAEAEYRALAAWLARAKKYTPEE